MKHPIPLLLAATMALTGCSHHDESVATGPRQVLLATASTASAVQTTSYPGRTRASVTTNVAFKVSGTLSSVSVKEGDYVRQGQVVARMDDRDYRTQLTATEAEYAQVEAEAGRVMALWADSATSENNYDKARYGLEQMAQKLSHHRDQVNDCVLRAPFDGYVQSVMHEAHETVGAGMAIVTMFTASGVEIVINIPATEYLKRETFDTFTATFDALPGQTFPLRLLNIGRRANANQLYEVRLALEGGLSQVTPGMSTTVTLQYKADEEQPVVVPQSAVFSDELGAAVLVYHETGDGEGRLERAAVVVGFIHSDGSTELASGLKAGDRVVVSGVHALKDGETVRPFPQPSPTNVGGLL